VKDITVQ